LNLYIPVISLLINYFQGKSFRRNLLDKIVCLWYDLASGTPALIIDEALSFALIGRDFSRRF